MRRAQPATRPRARLPLPTLHERRRAKRSSSSARISGSSLTANRPIQHLSYEAAIAAVDEARLVAAELGEPSLAPPVGLDDCNRAIVEAALGRPPFSWEGVEKYPTLEAKAAALLYAFATVQPCVDGNKRVTAILVGTFLRINGARLQIEPGELADLILEVATSENEDDALARSEDWMRRRIVPT